MPPERVVDVLALVGDSVDNVPGVPGIGEKGARDLVKEFGAARRRARQRGQDQAQRLPRGPLNNIDAAILSKSLVTLRTDVPGHPRPRGLEAPAARPLGRERALHRARVRRPGQGVRAGGGAEPHRVRRPHRARRRAHRRWKRRARRRRSRSASCATRASRMRAQPLGVALAWRRGHAVYVPLHHSPLEVPGRARRRAELMELLRPLFEDPLVHKLSARGKHDQIMLCEQGLGCESLGFDALIASYLLNPGRRQYTLEDLAVEFLGERPQPSSSLIEGGGEVSLSAAAAAATQDADIALRLEEPLTKRLDEEGLAGDLRADGAAAGRGPGRHGARGGQGRTCPSWPT